MKNINAAVYSVLLALPPVREGITQDLDSGRSLVDIPCKHKFFLRGSITGEVSFIVVNIRSSIGRTIIYSVRDIADDPVETFN